MTDATCEGGCLCGQVRWRAAGSALNTRVCHCRLCQRATGGPFFARAMFPPDRFERTGETVAWNTSPRVQRLACARCGTPMFALPSDPPARIAVSITTCDDRHALRPDCHIWVGEKVVWLAIDDGLPRFEAGYAAG
jgi:hypothetical protein